MSTTLTMTGETDEDSTNCSTNITWDHDKQLDKNYSADVTAATETMPAGSGGFELLLAVGNSVSLVDWLTTASKRRCRTNSACAFFASSFSSFSRSFFSRFSAAISSLVLTVSSISFCVCAYESIAVWISDFCKEWIFSSRCCSRSYQHQDHSLWISLHKIST